MIEAQKITFSPEETESAEGISFRLANGKHYGIFGKDSFALAKILGGIATPCTGSIRINGFSQEHNFGKVKRSVAFLPSHFSPDPDFTVYESLQFLASAYKVPGTKRFRTVNAAIEYAGLDDLRNRLIGKLLPMDLPFLGIASLLATDADILAAEDPTQVLNSEESGLFWDMFKDLPAEKTLFIASEDGKVLSRICDEILVLENGTLREILPVSELSDSSVYRLALSCEEPSEDPEGSGKADFSSEDPVDTVFSETEDIRSFWQDENRDWKLRISSQTDVSALVQALREKLGENVTLIPAEDVTDEWKSSPQEDVSTTDIATEAGISDEPDFRSADSLAESDSEKGEEN